jgi:hypothetical protein
MLAYGSAWLAHVGFKLLTGVVVAHGNEEATHR